MRTLDEGVSSAIVSTLNTFIHPQQKQVTNCTEAITVWFSQLFLGGPSNVKHFPSPNC